MQVIMFHTGGFVIHKIKHRGPTPKFSAWYDKDRNLIDAESIDILYRSRGVQRNARVWRELQEIGKNAVLGPIPPAPVAVPAVV